MPANNCSTFTGRLTKDPVLTTVGSGQNAFSKVNFTIAVDKRLSASEKQRKNQGEDIKTAYFVPVEASGKQADVIAQYFTKGSGIIVRAYYDEYNYTDQTGNKKYGHKFIMEDFSFPPTSAGQATNAGGGNGNYQQNQYVNNNIDNNQYAVPADEMPF